MKRLVWLPIAIAALFWLALEHGAFRGGDPDLARTVLLQLRLPRALAALLVGGSLAATGVALQALFRNPLADPGLLGVSAGAALGAGAAIVFGAPHTGAVLSAFMISLAGFVGGLGATAIVLSVARRSPGEANALILLVGAAITSLGFAGLGLLSFLADDARLRSLSLWTLGGLGAATWPLLPALACGTIAPFLLLWRRRVALDLLLFGEVEAYQAGVETKRLRRDLVLVSALGTAVCVAAAGSLAFIGLLVPHAARAIFGARHAPLLLGAAGLGAALVLGCDLLARTAAAPREIPLGIVTSLFGAPAFLWLLSRRIGRLAESA